MDNSLRLTINTLYSYDTEYCSDSIEWCPHAPFQNVFVCANYQLIEDDTEYTGSRKRLGRILLFSISTESGLTLHQTLNTSAILDQKWCHNKINNCSLLGVVNAEKRIEIYKFNMDIMMLDLIYSYEVQADGEVLLLSLDWSTGKYVDNTPNIICSDSNGNWHNFKFTDNKLVLENSAHVHKYEAWIAAFYYWNTNIFFTGNAFMKLQ